MITDTPGNRRSGRVDGTFTLVHDQLIRETPASAVALRIGYFAEHRPDPATTPPQELSAWLSPRDAAELVRAAVEADLPGFTVANGISANRYRVADLEATISRLHYRPVDDAWAN